MLLWISALSAGSGCNLVFGLDAPARDDGGPVDAMELDAPLGRFDDPRPVTATPDVIENDAILTADETEVIYALGTTTVPYDIVRASVTGGEWGPPETIRTLSTSVIEGFVRFGHGDTTLYFASDRPGGPGFLDIYRSTRNDRASAWTTPEVLDKLSSAGNDGTTAPCAGDTRFVITSDRDGEQALYEYDAQRAEAPTMFSVPLEQPRSPFLTEDCLSLYVTGGAQGDLYVLRRDAIEAPWTSPEPLAELNTADASESDVWLSPSGRHILFSRDGDIYEAFR